MEVLILNLLNVEDATSMLEETIKKSFATKGKDIVNNNILAIHEAISNLKELKVTHEYDETISIVDDSIINMINERRGNEIPVSKLMDFACGRFPGATTNNEKAKIFQTLFQDGLKENCIECGMCALACPHAVNRAIANESDADGIPL